MVLLITPITTITEVIDESLTLKTLQIVKQTLCLLCPSFDQVDDEIPCLQASQMHVVLSHSDPTSPQDSMEFTLHQPTGLQCISQESPACLQASTKRNVLQDSCARCLPLAVVHICKCVHLRVYSCTYVSTSSQCSLLAIANID